MHPNKNLFFKFVLILLTISIFHSQKAQAHSGSAGYSEVKIEGNQVNYELFLLGDLLGGLLNIDKNQDGHMKENEISQSKSEVEQFVFKNLSVINNGIKGEGTVKDIQLTNRGNYTMFHISIEYSYNQAIEEYEIDYNLFFNSVDKEHQNFMTISYNDRVIEHVFTQDNIVFQGHTQSEMGQAILDTGVTESVNENSKVEGSQSEDETLGFKEYFVMVMKHIWVVLILLVFPLIWYLRKYK
ncbi:hypothetical protein J2Y03_005637 [Neobacillus niacini]|uniref:hypothetical protein n=1 Tax=Neobacillus niacini TaxID=86668 RepID=UPI00285DED23|nr:hypothetical protein [Neobacillus niacini]MDR7080550.1 hypothetical protein [Neobacillus niacini]